MVSNLEYAVMANDAYAGGDVEPDRTTQFQTHAAPDGWEIIYRTRVFNDQSSPVRGTELNYSSTVDPVGGNFGYTDKDFYAVAYRNTEGEVVIAYRGTTGSTEGGGSSEGEADTVPIGNAELRVQTQLGGFE